MRYFVYIADQGFKKGEQGETLFFLGGPFSRPLVIEDEQKASTYQRHLWMQRVFLGALIIGQPFLFHRVPQITSLIWWFLGYLFGLGLLNWLAQRVVFRRELRECPRLEKRMSLRGFYGQMADSHSAEALVLGFVGSMLFVAVGVLLLFEPTSGDRLVGMVCCVFFGGCSLGWGYAWRLKTGRITEGEQDAPQIRPR